MNDIEKKALIEAIKIWSSDEYVDWNNENPLCKANKELTAGDNYDRVRCYGCPMLGRWPTSDGKLVPVCSVNTYGVYSYNFHELTEEYDNAVHHNKRQKVENWKHGILRSLKMCLAGSPA